MQEEINNQSMLRVGTVLRGIYRIDSYLSSGGFGNTYVATNIEFNERVAVKEFFMKGVSQRDDNQSTVSISNTANRNSFLEQKDKFKKEARRLRQLNNPHIVKVYDLFDENGTSYYVMDYIDGENLSERLKRTGKRMSQKTVNEILPQILDALKTVHEAGFWHLDLKPANIMLDKSGNVKLIDFGASKQFDVQKGGATTGTAISYTNGYAPREQMEQNYDKFGPWTDLYALGATLYKMLTNSNPPLPTDIDDDMSEDKHEALPFPATISKDMRGLVLWMMSTNRNKRPQSIEEVERFMKNKPSNATEQESPATGSSNPKPTLAPNPSSDSDEGTVVAGEEKKSFNEATYAIPSEYLNSPTETTNKAQSGVLDAIIAIGMMNLRGQGILQDTDIAYLWFDKAKEQGDYRAKWVIDHWSTLRNKYNKNSSETTNSYEDQTSVSSKWKKWALLSCVLAFVIGIVYIVLGQKSSNSINYADEFSKYQEIYYKSNITDAEKSTALAKIQELSTKGYSPASFMLGFLEKDSLKALKYFQNSHESLYSLASKGDMFGQYYYGEYMLKTADDSNASNAFEWLKKSADQGFSKAMTEVANCYILGYGTTQNFDKALELYTTAADAGDEYAQRNLGYFYEKGLICDIDSAQAIKWYKEAASQGNANAIAHMGYFHLHSKVDIQKAYDYFYDAAQKGDAEGYFYLGVLYSVGSDEYPPMEKNISKSIEYLKKSLECENAVFFPMAYIWLADCYYDLKDYDNMFAQELAGAEAGYPVSQGRVADCYEKGIGTKVNREKAKYWRKKSADPNNLWNSGGSMIGPKGLWYNF